MDEGSKLVLKTLELIEKGKANPKPQPKTSNLKEAPKLTSENTRINWSKSGKEIEAFIRGLSPYPVAWTILHNNNEESKTKIYSANFERSEQNLKPGSILISKKELKVACADGFIIINEIQLPGKRKMDVSSLLNGYSFDEDSKLS